MRISFSALETFEQCPLKYKYQEIDRIPTPKSKEAVFGSIIHSTLKFIHTPGLLVPDLEQALDYFSKHWNSDVYESEIEEREAFSQGVKIIQRYFEQNDPRAFTIVDLESRFQIDIAGHTVPGIIDRIDRTSDGYEIIDYKTARKMPSQESIDQNLQLSVYLKAFLARYPKEIANLGSLKVSLYFLKHGVKLTSARTAEDLDRASERFTRVVAEIEKGKFEPMISGLCDWCGYQKICPMWRHKFKDERKLDNAEIQAIIAEYLQAKTETDSLKSKIGELQEKISGYMDQEGVDRVFGESGIIARTLRRTYKYDEKTIREILAPLDKWDAVVKVDGVALKRVASSLPASDREKIEAAKVVDKESKSFTVKKSAE